jgi:Flp pilus assembly protein TadD
LGEELEAAGRWPEVVLPTRPSGRPEREAADALFEQRRLETEAAPEDWQAWYRLGLAYGDAGDRRRARAALRHAIALHDGPP